MTCYCSEQSVISVNFQGNPFSILGRILWDAAGIARTPLMPSHPGLPISLCPRWIHVQIMVFLGFGFLMTFLRRYSLGAVMLNFLGSCLIFLVAILIVGAAHQVRTSRAGVCLLTHVWCMRLGELEGVLAHWFFRWLSWLRALHTACLHGAQMFEMQPFMRTVEMQPFMHGMLCPLFGARARLWMCSILAQACTRGWRHARLLWSWSAFWLLHSRCNNKNATRPHSEARQQGTKVWSA